MSQNITLLGASYNSVPAVQLPKTGGGTATFTDVTDTTASASDVAQGKYFYNASGVRTAGTSSGGGGGGSASVQTDTAQPISGAAQHIIFGGLNGQPTSFAIMLGTNGLSPSEDPVIVGVVYDGTNLHAQTITNTSNAQVSYSTDVSMNYLNGELAISTEALNFYSEYLDYMLVYTYDGSSSDIHTANVQVGSGATSVTFSGLAGNPIYWSCIFKSNFGTSSGYQRVIEVVNDGTGGIYGLEMDSSAKIAQHWTATYSGGSLTISSNGTNQGGYFHQPGYYQLTYAVDPNALTFQNKTGVRASTSSQTIYPDTGYDALESVQIEPVSQTNLIASNIKSGVTVNISNGQSNLWSVVGTYTGSGGGGSASIDTKTVTASNRPTSLSFTSMKGEPIAFFLRCTSSMSRSSQNSYYYVATMRYNGTNTTGNCWRMSNGNWTNITSGYSFTYSGTTLTVSSNGSTTTSPGCFYPGTYELVYVY